MAEIHGTCDERFTKVRDTLAANLDAGDDVGASVAIYLEGEPVVDIWGGRADASTDEPWAEDTITNVWSTTKTMTALCALILADQGEIDMHAPVAKYWPEFKANGKESIEVRHLMSHTAGLSGWAEPMTVDDLYDWEKATSVLAAQEPWWEPGTASGYHAVTQGYLVGEVIRRVTGRTVGQFLAAEVAGPLGADFHIGLAPTEFGRVSNVIPPPPIEIPAGLDPMSPLARTFGNPVLSAELAWTAPWREAEIPAANGHGNARSVGRIQSIVSNHGEIGGRRFLSDAGCARIFEQQISGTDLILGVPLVLGIGYGLVGPDAPLSPNARSCFWGGWGGSLVVNDLDARMTFAYMMNRMETGLVGDLRGFALIASAYESLGG